MIEVEEALRLILDHARPLRVRRVPVGDALGLTLAEDVASDVDSPPFDKSIVDGYAVVAADLAGGTARLRVLEEITAGALPARRVERGTTTRIMTGAPIPDGAEAVVMVERSRFEPFGVADGDGLGTVELREERTVAAGQNVLRRGQAMRRGDVVLSAGAEIRPAEVGLLCEIGCVEPPVVPRPRVAILPTGNEIIPPHEQPVGGQIRNTNGPMLAAAVRRAGGVPAEIGIARDDPADLRRTIALGLRHDVLLLSGGVSAGVLDLVPKALNDLGVRQVFHKVRFKPGKPLWFGVLPAEGGDRLVFGLPGNPVSSLVCFEMFVRPALARLAGYEGGMRRGRGRLAIPFNHRGDRPTYHPARLTECGAGVDIGPLPWQGSADLRGLAQANGLARFPAGDRAYRPGDELEIFWL